MIVFSHHKCATRWLLDYLTRVADLNDILLYHSDFLKTPDKSSPGIVFYGNSTFDFISRHYATGIHVVRNPMSILLSAYYSHRETHPTDGWPELAAQRRALRHANLDDGLRLTLAFLERWNMHANAAGPLWALRLWNFDDERFTTLRMEDAVEGLSGVLPPLMRADLDRPDLVFPADEEFAFSRFSGGRRVGEADERSHYRSGARDDWRYKLPASLVHQVRETFRPLLERFYPEAMLD